MRDLAKFRRAMRVDNPKDYAKAFRKAKRVGGAGLTILSVDNSMAHPRLGLAIAKKHVKSAVKRNELKRLVRESFRHHQTMFASIDIIVLSRADINKLDKSKIRAALVQHWLSVKTQWQKF